VRAARLEQLRAVEGVGPKMAQRLKEGLKQPPPGGGA